MARNWQTPARKRIKLSLTNKGKPGESRGRKANEANAFYKKATPVGLLVRLSANTPCRIDFDTNFGSGRCKNWLLEQPARSLWEFATCRCPRRSHISGNFRPRPGNQVTPNATAQTSRPSGPAALDRDL